MSGTEKNYKEQQERKKYEHICNPDILSIPVVWVTTGFKSDDAFNDLKASEGDKHTTANAQCDEQQSRTWWSYTVILKWTFYLVKSKISLSSWQKKLIAGSIIVLLFFLVIGKA